MLWSRDPDCASEAESGDGVLLSSPHLRKVAVHRSYVGVVLLDVGANIAGTRKLDRAFQIGKSQIHHRRVKDQVLPFNALRFSHLVEAAPAPLLGLIAICMGELSPGLGMRTGEREKKGRCGRVHPCIVR